MSKSFDVPAGCLKVKKYTAHLYIKTVSVVKKINTAIACEIRMKQLARI